MAPILWDGKARPQAAQTRNNMATRSLFIRPRLPARPAAIFSNGLWVSAVVLSPCEVPRDFRYDFNGEKWNKASC